MVEFGTRLRQLRKEKNLTQKQLASLIGVQHAVISFYELIIPFFAEKFKAFGKIFVFLLKKREVCDKMRMVMMNGKL